MNGGEKDLLIVLGLAVALGTDAFSLAVGIGMKGINFKENLKISGTIGIMHIVMPLIGYYLGSISGKLLGTAAGYVGGAILIILGVLMLKNALRSEEEKGIEINYKTGVGLFALSAGVSLDALSVGFSLGTIGVNLWLTILVLGLVSALMTGGGLFLGDRVGGFLGKKAEFIGALILIGLGGKVIYELIVG